MTFVVAGLQGSPGSLARKPAMMLIDQPFAALDIGLHSGGRPHEACAPTASRRLRETAAGQCM